MSDDFREEIPSTFSSKFLTLFQFRIQSCILTDTLVLISHNLWRVRLSPNKVLREDSRERKGRAALYFKPTGVWAFPFVYSISCMKWRYFRTNREPIVSKEKRIKDNSFSKWMFIESLNSWFVNRTPLYPSDSICAQNGRILNRMMFRYPNIIMSGTGSSTLWLSYDW